METNSPKISGSSRSQPPATRPVLLIVDDDPDDCVLLQRAMAKGVPELQTICLHDCDSAIAYLSGSPPYDNRIKNPLPDVVTIDIDLGGKSGLELLVWIRKHPVLKTLPAVVLSQSLWENDRKTANFLGASYYYHKPHGFDELIAMGKEIGGRCQPSGR